MDFKALTKQFASSDVLGLLASSVGGDEGDVGKAAALGLPAIMEALNRNSNTEDGAAALSNALDAHKSGGSDVASMLENIDMEDGEKMLGHIFGDKSDSVAKSISNKTGMDKSQIIKLLIQFAPVIMNFLGDQKEEEGLDSGGVSGLTSTLSGLFGGGGSSSSSGGAGNLLSLASSFLDDGDDEDEGGMDLLGALGGLFG